VYDRQEYEQNKRSYSQTMMVHADIIQ
jgi:hypothetical protein